MRLMQEDYGQSGYDKFMSSILSITVSINVKYNLCFVPHKYNSLTNH